MVSTVTRQRTLRIQGMTSGAIASAVERGELQRLHRGLYAVTAAEDAITEKHTFVQAAQLVPHGVFCLTSALTFHQLTIQNHRVLQIALPRPAHEPAIPFMPVSYFHLSEKHYQAGLQEHRVEGTIVKVYSPAKTVVDLFKFRHRFGTDLALEALREVWRKRRATTKELYTHAKTCRMENVMRPYLEAVIA